MLTGSGGDELTLRWPRRLRVGYAVFFAVWCAFLASFFVTAEDTSLLWRALPALMLAAGVVAGVRMLRLQVRTEGDDLVVSNPWRTHRIRRSDLAGFSTSRYARAGQERVYADLRDGRSVRLVVLDPFPWPGRDRAAEPVLDRLEAWRTGGTTVAR